MRKPAIPETPCMVKINVTPIIDVALVLVIILLVTAPILSVADLDIQLPTAHTRGAEDERSTGHGTCTVPEIQFEQMTESG